MKILWLLLLAGFHGFTQTIENSQGNAGEYVGVAGSPYFIKDWSEGIIRFSSGRVIDKFKLKFNCVQNRLMLQFNGSVFAAESKINEFVLYTKNKKDSFVFRKGYPATERGNGETFYQVLDNGPVFLLQLAIKDIVEEKEILDSKRSRHFQDLDHLYLFRDGIMTKIDEANAPLQDIFADKWEELKKFISEQQLKMRSAEDLTKVVKKYNALR